MLGPNDVKEIVTFQWKAGGWLAVACAAVGGLIQWQRASIQECPGGYSHDAFGERYCPTVEIINELAIATIFGAVVLGGFIGVVIALILLKLGMRHDTLGIDPDA